MRSTLTVSKKNSETIDFYIKDCALVKNLRGSSPRNNAGFLRKLADFLGNIEFKDCTVEDMKRFITTINYSDESKEPLKVAIRQFYCWLYKTEEYPPNVKWFTLKSQKERLEVREIDSIKKKIVAIEEYQRMVSHVSGNMQNQAILEILYWSGCRVGELVSMNICDIELHEDFVLLSIRKSKTKKRQIPIKPVPELLLRWLDNHPMKSNPDAPLFISFNRRLWHSRLSVHYIEQEFRILCKELGMRRITPHCFRHSSITRDLANNMPKTHCCTKYGWTKSSSMVEIYDHNSADELVEYVTGKPKNTPTPSIDILQQQKLRLEKEMNEKQQLETRLEAMERAISIMTKSYDEKSRFAQGFIKDGYQPEEIPEKYRNFIDGVSKIMMKVLNSGYSEEKLREYMDSISKLIT